jgi:hypothetical protein
MAGQVIVPTPRPDVRNLAGVAALHSTAAGARRRSLTGAVRGCDRRLGTGHGRSAQGGRLHACAAGQPGHGPSPGQPDPGVVRRDRPGHGRRSRVICPRRPTVPAPGWPAGAPSGAGGRGRWSQDRGWMRRHAGTAAPGLSAAERGAGSGLRRRSAWPRAALERRVRGGARRLCIECPEGCGGRAAAHGHLCRDLRHLRQRRGPLAESFKGVAPPPGDARPAWKVLRVLGNMAGVPGFDYVSSEQVRDELKARFGEDTAFRQPGVPGRAGL